MTKCMRPHWLSVILFLLLFLVPIESGANDTAHGLWGVGVQVGFAELGANQGLDPGFVVSALSYARTLAIQSGCIPTDEIDGLLAAVLKTRDSRTVYPSITAYRQRLATYIVNNCNCGGAGTIADPKNVRCEQYAKTAVNQNEENLKRGCGYAGDRWQPNYNNHYGWCMNVDQAAADSENRGRQDDLSRCSAGGGPPKPGLARTYRCPNLGTMQFTWNGDAVTGTYSWSGGGKVQGRMQGNTLVGQWSDGNGRGNTKYEFTPDRSKFEHYWQFTGASAWSYAGTCTEVQR